MTDIHDTADLVRKALRRAWQLGQTYWQQADSEYPSQWKKADVTQATFNQLVEDTRAALTSNSGAQIAPSVPDDVLKDAERYRFLERLCATGTYGGIISRKAVDAAMLAAAPEAKT